MSSEIYLPKFFEYSEDRTLIKKLLGGMQFGQVLSIDAAGCINVSYTPVEVDVDNKEMIFHLSVSNKHAEHLTEGGEMTFIWNGPGVYISPSIYVNNGVPTWNYVAILIDGVVEPINIYKEKLDHLERLSNMHEKKGDNPWLMGSLGKERIQKAISRLSFFKVSIATIKAKIKMSQNKAKEDIEVIYNHLEKISDNEEVNDLISMIKGREIS